jgi:predicted dehydrogenase
MATAKPLRVGFIGTGWTERVQIPMFRLAGLTAQAICSGNPENAQRVAAAANLPDTYPDWQSLIASETVDVVSIVTPPHLHAEIAIAALQAGKHVICEKPTARNVAEAEAMFAAAQAAPDQLAIIDHELRFNPARIKLRQLLRDGYLGNVLTVQLDRLGSEKLNPDLPWRWHDDAARGGGMLGALGSHLLDLARWLVGRVEGVSAQLQTAHLLRNDPRDGSPQQVTADDHAQLQLRFAGGIPGTVTVSGITPGGYGMSILVVGTKGALRLDNQDQLWGAQGADLVKGNWQPIAVAPLAPELAAYSKVNHSPFVIGTFYLAQRMATALSAGEQIIEEAASFYDGLVVQRMVDAARRSQRERAWVQL